MDPRKERVTAETAHCFSPTLKKQIAADREVLAQDLDVPFAELSGAADAVRRRPAQRAPGQRAARMK